MMTGVAHNGMCASACVLAWASGWRKSVATDSRIGVHMAEDANNKIAGNATLVTVNWLKTAGAPASVIAGAVTTQPDDIYWLSRSELVAWNVNIIDADDASIATSEPAEPPAATLQPEPTPRRKPKTAALRHRTKAEELGYNSATGDNCENADFRRYVPEACP